MKRVSLAMMAVCVGLSLCFASNAPVLAHTERAEKTPKTRADILWQQADDAFHKGDYALAIEHYREFLKLEPDNADAYSNAAWLLWSTSRGKEAVQLIREGVRKNPRSWAMLYAAGQHFDLQKIEPMAAYIFYERAFALNPRGHSRWLTLHRLAFAAEKAGRPARALQVWQRNLIDFPNDPVAVRKARELSAQPSAQPSVPTSSTSS